MTVSTWIQLVCLVALIGISTPILGSYLAKVYGDEREAPGDRIFGPVERLVYRACGIDPEGEQHWGVYATSMLAFSCASVLVLYGLQRLQGHLPLNPDHL